MRKTLNINLGGLAFIIDENAFELLHNYLVAVKQKFNNQQEQEEIMNDIESRIAEMLTQKLADRKEVVSVEEVQSVIDAMGRPEDIAGEDDQAATGSSGTSSTSSSTINQPVKKKLFRDTDDAKIGGVISGLCHYFGIHDPVWVRIAAIILIPFTSGSIILIYLLLLIIVPKALTAADKLQMKGEPININTIEKEIREAAGKAGESIHRIVKDQNFFERLWGIITSLLKVVLKLGSVFVLIVATVCLIAVVLGFSVFYIFGTSPLKDASLLLVDNIHTISYFSFGFLLAFGTPIIGLIYLALKTLLGQRSEVKWLKWALLGGWCVGVVLLFISVFHTLTNFKNDTTLREKITLTQPVSGSLKIQIADSDNHKFTNEQEENEDFNVDFDGVIINGVNIKDMVQIPIGKPDLQIIPSENDSFYIQEVMTSQGRNRKDADNNAAMVVYSFSQSDTLLNLGSHFYLPKSGKWRDQFLKLKVAVPEGKKISFADNIAFWSVSVKDENTYDDTNFANTVWTVEGGKVKCLIGENHKHEKNAEDRPGHTKVTIHLKNDDEPGDKDKKEEDKNDQDF